ncbi:MAG: hypothetical protein SGARI_007090 [Bacillariaceae sp.]
MEEYGLKKNSFSIDGLPSLGLIRNKDKTIEMDPQEGYIYGKEVTEGGVANLDYKVPPQKRILHSNMMMTSQEGLVMLAVGALLGSVISGLYFQYVHEQT